MIMPNIVYKDADGFRLEFDSDIQEEEKKFYTKVYPTIDLVCERKVHCTVCDAHIGTAPAQESTIRMHPVLRVTHCKKCHDFYNSGEFSKGEDGSELYCRWCGQGGEVYCCSKCPYVFCKNCIVQNLSKGCVNDIEENENWNCFVCAPKIMWHLRAQHWALMNFIEKQKNSILSDEDLTDTEIRRLMTRDKSTCCRKRHRSGNMSDSSCDSSFSSSKKKKDKKLRKLLPKTELNRQRTESPDPKRFKLGNDEVVCTPDVLSMLARDTAEPEQSAPPSLPPPAPAPAPAPTSTPTPLTIQPTKAPTPPVKATPVAPPQKTTATATSPQILTIPISPQQKPMQHRQVQQVQTQQIIQNIVQQQEQPSSQINVQPPPLIIRNFSPQLRTGSPTVVTRKTVVGPRAPVVTPGTTPVYHTINGFRIDLNSAAQQETFRLPNGKLIQVKKQGTATGTGTGTNTQPANMLSNNPVNNGMNAMNTVNAVNAVNAMNNMTVNGQVMRAQITPRGLQAAAHSMVQQQPQTVQNFQVQSPQLATIRYAPGCGQVIPGTTTITATIPNGQGGTQVHLLNGTPVQQVQQLTSRPTPIPTLVRQFFSATPLGQARSQLQNQIFSAMEICQHLTGKIHTLTNSNAYKSVRNYTDVKELYIHLSYLFTYAIGRFKGLQDKCLEDMRRIGFAGDAASLESGQLEMDNPSKENHPTIDSLDHSQEITACKTEDTPDLRKQMDELIKAKRDARAKRQREFRARRAAQKAAQKEAEETTIEEAILRRRAATAKRQREFRARKAAERAAAQSRTQYFLATNSDMTMRFAAVDSPTFDNLAAEKHAEDGDEDEVEIVEPKTTCIDLDSDNEDCTPLVPAKAPAAARNSTASQQMQQLPQIVNVQQLGIQSPQQSPPILLAQSNPPNPIQQQIDLGPPTTPTPQMQMASTPTTPSTPGSDLRRLSDCDFDVTANLLAGMLEVELTEGNPFFSTPAPENVPKKPRKKTTNKPNPHLIKQQQIQERERIREMIRRDPKLNSKCHVVLDRIEYVMPEVMRMLEERKSGKIKTRTISLTLEAGEFDLKKDTDSKKAVEVSKEVKADNQSTNNENKEEPTKVPEELPKITEENPGEEIEEVVGEPIKSTEDKNDEDKNKDEGEKNEQKGDKGEKEESNDIVLEDKNEEKETEVDEEPEVRKNQDTAKELEKQQDETEDTVELMEVDEDMSEEASEEKMEDSEEADGKKETIEEEKSQKRLEPDEKMKDSSLELAQQKKSNHCDNTQHKEVSDSKGKENANETEKGGKEEYLTVIEVVEGGEGQEAQERSSSQNSDSANANDKSKEVAQLHEEITAILENGFRENSQDSMKHSPITSGDSLDYLAAMDE